MVMMADSKNSVDPEGKCSDGEQVKKGRYNVTESDRDSSLCV